MTSGPDHYREAERLAENYKLAVADVDKMPGDTSQQKLDRSDARLLAHGILAKAQVHATLALVAATVDQTASRGPGDVDMAWKSATS